MISSQSSGGGRRGRFRRSSHHEEVALQITSMADIFTILLVFLLKSYSVSAMNVSVGKDLHLPTARGGNEQVEALKVEISESSVSVEGQVVVQLKNYEPSLSELNRDGSLKAVEQVLESEKQKQRSVASAMGTQKEERDEPNRKLLIIADKKVPYKLMKRVLSSASNQDFTDFKLVVVSED
jgi:biopolymer transport protein ExbD